MEPASDQRRSKTLIKVHDSFVRKSGYFIKRIVGHVTSVWTSIIVSQALVSRILLSTIFWSFSTSSYTCISHAKNLKNSKDTNQNTLLRTISLCAMLRLGTRTHVCLSSRIKMSGYRRGDCHSACPEGLNHLVFYNTNILSSVNYLPA